MIALPSGGNQSDYLFPLYSNVHFYQVRMQRGRRTRGIRWSRVEYNYARQTFPARETSPAHTTRRYLGHGRFGKEDT
jgi:hypothetical protein